MPKISAPTLAEHRAAQRKALLRAASDLIVSDGVSAVTPKAVGARAGIARSSVYDYFSTTEDLIVAVAIDAFEDWARDMAAALEEAEPGLPRLRRHIEATMEMTADGGHMLASALRGAELSPRRTEEIAALHTALLGPLMEVLIEAGVQSPARHVAYVQALIGVGVGRVGEGDDPVEVADLVYRLVTRGVPLPAADS